MKSVWLGRAVLVVLAPLLTFMLLEGLLRLTWINPYTAPPPVDRYQSRLGDPWWRASAYTGGLYEGGGRIQGVRTQFRSLSSGGPDATTPVLALGGSTTEAVLVPEGQRWPDLLHPPAMNYGVAENSVIDSYRNLSLLLNEMDLRPQRILLMHAVNDLTEILRAPDHFGMDLLPHRPIHKDTQGCRWSSWFAVTRRSQPPDGNQVGWKRWKVPGRAIHRQRPNRGCVENSLRNK